MTQSLIAEPKLQQAPARKIDLDDLQQAMERVAPEGIPNMPPDMLAKPGDTSGVAVLPDATAAAVFDIMRTAQSPALPKGIRAFTIEQGIEGRLHQSERRDAQTLLDPFFHGGAAELGGRIVVRKNAPHQEIVEVRHEGATFGYRIEE